MAVPLTASLSPVVLGNGSFPEKKSDFSLGYRCGGRQSVWVQKERALPGRDVLSYSPRYEEMHNGE